MIPQPTAAEIAGLAASVVTEALFLYGPGALLGLLLGRLMKTPARAFLAGFVLTTLSPAVAVWTLAVARPEMAARSPLANVVAPAVLVLLSGVLIGGGAAAEVWRRGSLTRGIWAGTAPSPEARVRSTHQRQWCQWCQW